MYRRSVRFNRLSEDEVAYACFQRLRKLKMWSTLREIITFTGFLIVLCMLTYSNHNQNSFLQVNHLRKFFLNTKQTNDDYTKV
jgi:hypothetical protein